MNKYRVGLIAAGAAAGLGLVIASHAGAAGNPVEERQSLMKQQGQVMKEAGALLAPNGFDAAKAKTLMGTLASSADKLHALYPASSKDAPKTEALPKIWENKADFDKRLSELAKLAKDAGGASSVEAFKPAYMSIGKACKDCHDTYRAKKS